MQHPRRELLTNALVLVPALGLMGRAARAQDEDQHPTPLDPQEPTAKAFAFVTDASKVDASAHPTYRAGQACAGCSQYLGKETDATAGCSIFGGRSVPAAGWCKVWSQRSG